jgi:hypothetical protein
MPPKVRRHILKASSHVVAIDALRKQRKEVQGTLRTMRSALKQDYALTLHCLLHVLDSSVPEAVPGTLFTHVLQHCNVDGICKENRKHARLMQKANRLGAQDLLEIAAMKGMTMFTNPNPEGGVASATEPPVGCGASAVPSILSASSASCMALSVAAVQGDDSKTPTTPVALVGDLDEIAIASEHEASD